MVFILTSVSQFWGRWGLQIAVYCSFGSHLILIVFARSRRHGTCPLARWVLWLAYQAAEVSAFYALGDLTLSSCNASASRQQQLIAFWAPFMVLHLGGPDNITAYALEDNKLSVRKLFEMVVQMASCFFALYNDIWLTESGVLIPASVLMAAAGFAKYIEKNWALFRGNLGKMKIPSSSTESGDHLNLLSSAGGAELGDNERALLNAHKLFPCCKRSMSDSSVFPKIYNLDSYKEKNMKPHRHFPSEKIFTLGWKEISTVVEMELSLIYDIIYTKAGVIHTWHGYLVRLVSPLLTGAAAVLFFWFYPKHDLEPRDVHFTYIMLAATFLLDVLWLVKALGSYWTYSYLRNPRSTAAWLLPHAVRHGEWLRRGWFHRVVACLDPCWWLYGRDPRSYRRWSGVAGRCNLLEECTRAARAGTPSLHDWIKKRKHRYLCFLFKCSQSVEKMLFEEIQQRLRPMRKSEDSTATGNKQHYTMKQITAQWGHVVLQQKGPTLLIQQPNLGLEFQEDILVWHIGTSILLWRLDESKRLVDEGRQRYKEAINLVSEYLMFLVALRPHMLPGLVLRSLFETTCKSLVDVWQLEGENEQGNGPNNSESGKDKLARILYHKEDTNWWGANMVETRLLCDGIHLAHALLTIKSEEQLDTLLVFIFDVWVDKLIHAGVKCSREAHAKQLSRGGELTTIVWMIVEHIGTFRIGEKTGLYRRLPVDDKKKKEEEERKPKKEEEERKRKPKKEEEERKPPEGIMRRPRPRSILRGEGFDDSKPIRFSTLYPAY